MIKTVLILCLFFLLTGAAYAQKTDNKKIHVGLVYPLSSNGSHAPQDTNKFSLNIIAGVSAAEDDLHFPVFPASLSKMQRVHRSQASPIISAVRRKVLWLQAS